MANSSILQVIIKVSKQGTGDKEAAAQAKQLKGALNELGLGSLATMGALGALAAVVGTVTSFTAKAVDGTVKYANEIRGLKLLTGENAEETGRVIQVMDDFKIKTDSLTAAQKQLAKSGLSLNIETLAKLSDEYKTLGTGAEKTRFLLDKFGKTGLQFAEAMETGGDALRQMSTEVDASMLLTEQQLQQSRQYELALDSLNGQWEKLSRTVGTTAIPMLTTVSAALDKNIQSGDLWWKMLANLVPPVGLTLLIQDLSAAQTELDASAAATDGLAAANSAAAPTAEELAAKEKEVADEAKALSDVLKNQLGLMFDLQGESQKFTEKQEELRVKQSELAAQVTQQPWNQELRAELAETNAALEENTQKHEEATRRILFSMLQQQLGADGLSQADFEALNAIGIHWGLLDENVARQASSIQESIQKYLATGDLAAFNGEVERTMGLPSSKTFTFTTQVNTVYSTTGQPPQPPGQNLATPYAEGTGGWLQVPSGFPNDTYPIRLSSGEKFAVIPAGGGPSSAGGAMSMGSGGGVNVYLTYAPALSLASESEINERLLPFIREGIRSVQNGR